MSKKIDVTVFSADYTEKSRGKLLGCPARIMPGGKAGVLHNSWVFPVHRLDGDDKSLRIFLEGTSRLGKKKCPPATDEVELNFVEIVSKTDELDDENPLSPIERVSMDQDQARELLNAKKELDERMERSGPLPQHSRGLPGDRNKPNSGKRRTMQVNPRRKKN